MTLLVQMSEAPPPIAGSASVWRYGDDNDLNRCVNVENAVLVTCKNPLPNDRRDWGADLRILTNVAYRYSDFIHELLGGRKRVPDEVTDMFLKFLVGLFEEAVRLQRPLTRE
jgi:hypothetical protein